MSVTDIVFKKSKGWTLPEAGEWCRYKGQIFVRCPHGHLAQITGHPGRQDWNVSQTGKVTPSIWWTLADCGCHVWATLENYDKE